MLTNAKHMSDSILFTSGKHGYFLCEQKKEAITRLRFEVPEQFLPRPCAPHRPGLEKMRSRQPGRVPRRRSAHRFWPGSPCWLAWSTDLIPPPPLRENCCCSIPRCRRIPGTSSTE